MGGKPSMGSPSKKIQEENGRLWAVRWVAVPFFLLYAAGCLFPQTWWGTHFLLFLPRTLLVVFAASALSLFLFFEFPRRESQDTPETTTRGVRRTILIVLLFSILCALAYYFLSTETDIYGDARRNLKFVTGKTGAFNPDWVREIFSLDIFNRATGESLVLNLVLLTGWLLKLDGPEAFGVVNAAFGFTFALTWCLFVRSQIRSAWLAAVLAVVGVTAGFAVVFTDHAEVYAPAAVFLLLFLVTDVQCLSRQNRWALWLLPVFLFLAIRSFFGSNILWAPFLLTMAYLEFKKNEWFFLGRRRTTQCRLR